jgi:hypothetical protein
MHFESLTNLEFFLSFSHHIRINDAVLTFIDMLSVPASDGAVPEVDEIKKNLPQPQLMLRSTGISEMDPLLRAFLNTASRALDWFLIGASVYCFTQALVLYFVFNGN